MQFMGQGATFTDYVQTRICEIAARASPASSVCSVCSVWRRRIFSFSLSLCVFMCLWPSRARKSPRCQTYHTHGNSPRRTCSVRCSEMEVGCAAALSHVCLSISSFLFWCFSDAFLMNLMKQDFLSSGLDAQLRARTASSCVHAVQRVFAYFAYFAYSACPPFSYAWLSEKRRQTQPLFCNLFIIYTICKSGGYTIAPKSHLTAKKEGRSHPLFCNLFIIYTICKSGG